MTNLIMREEVFADDIQEALNNERIDGFEALLRWQHPVKGVLEPTEFMPLIKVSALKEQLDYMVFE